MSKRALLTLRHRADFVALTERGKRVSVPGFTLQALAYGTDAGLTGAPPKSNTVGIGLTASRKVGGAVVRNKAKRRLRALVREVFALHAKPMFAYVLVARPVTATRAYDDLRHDLATALKRLDLWQE